MSRWTSTLTVIIMCLFSAGFASIDFWGDTHRVRVSEQMYSHIGTLDAILRALKENQPCALSQLLSEGVDVNSKDPVGNTALMYVALEGGTDAIKTLISLGADVNVRGDDGSTPLMYAVLSDSVETVRVLLEAGASVNIRNKAGLTALEMDSATPISFSLPFLRMRLTVKRRNSEVTMLLKQYAISNSW